MLRESIISLLLSVTVSVPLQAQQGEPDIEYAEIMPLADRSLLLDIVLMPGGKYVAVGERGHVIRSDDGLAWDQAEIVPTRSTLTTVTQAGGRLWAAGHDTVILTSGDGGVTWTRQYFDSARKQPVMDIHFSDAHNGIATGAYGLALFTRDGGASWEDGLINEEEWHNNAVLDAPGGTLIVPGEAGQSYRSTDGGQSWEVLEMPYPGSMFGAVEAAGGCVVMFGLRGSVQESCDAGDSWMVAETGTESSISGAVQAGSRTIMVGNSGLVLIRNADGQFEVDMHSSGVDFAAIAPLGEGFVLVGEGGVHHYPEGRNE